SNFGRILSIATRVGFGANSVISVCADAPAANNEMTRNAEDRCFMTNKLPRSDLFFKFLALGRTGGPFQRFLVSGDCQIATVFFFVIGADKESQHKGRKPGRSESQ